APPALAGLHPRTPVVLPREWWAAWLDSGVEGDQGMVDAAVAASVPVADGLEFFEVGPVRGDGPGLVERVSGSRGLRPASTTGVSWSFQVPVRVWVTLWGSCWPMTRTTWRV